MNYHELFTYVDKTGDLVWKERPLGHFPSTHGWKLFNKRFANKIAGSKARRHSDNKPQSVIIAINRKCSYLAHRIIWEMHHGPIPIGQEVDHINGDPWDNRLCNLRIATSSQNQWNKGLQINNKSGYKGVYWYSPAKKWMAKIDAGGKPVWCRRFDDAKTAHEERVKALKQFHGEFSRH